jgi:glucose-6-phosphate 1-epimerase
MRLPVGVKVEEPVPGYPVYVIEHARAKARVALHGAQVLEWTPTGESPVIYLSPDAVFKEGKAIRGGVPICWPWFNAHPSDASKPSHGFARTRFWNLMEIVSNADGVMMKMETWSDEASRALWPFEFRLQLTVTMGKTLKLVLETLNLGEVPFVVGEALHAYLKVGDVSKVSVEGLEDADYLDTVGERVMRSQKGAVEFDREVDRQYVSSDRITLVDESLGRKMEISKRGSGTTTVWNPWVDRARELGDLPDEDYKEFVCVEPANAGPTVVTVPPGGRHVIESCIRVLR